MGGGLRSVLEVDPNAGWAPARPAAPALEMRDGGHAPESLRGTELLDSATLVGQHRNGGMGVYLPRGGGPEEEGGSGRPARAGAFG